MTTQMLMLDPLVRVSDLITVSDIQSTGLWAPRRSMNAGDAAEHMRLRDYDVAPIADTPVHRFVERADLGEAGPDDSVDRYAQELTVQHLVAGNLSVGDALEMLSTRDWVFVLDGHDVSGVLTVADLHLLPVSLVVFGFILAVEAGIDELVSRHMSGGAWEEHLSQDRRAKVRQVFAERRKRNSEISLQACLNLNDRMRLARCEPMRTTLGMSSTEIRRLAERVGQLRDSLAHGDTLADVFGDARAGIEAALDARRFSVHVWESI